MAYSPFAPLIAPSILSADMAALGDECESVIAAGADWIHFDVMDNHYVPNLTFGPPVCQSLAKRLSNSYPNVPIDVHLMCEPVDDLIRGFADAGAASITFHPEATRHVDRSLALARDLGCKTGLVFNPATSLEWLKYVLDKVDILQIMSVNPGFGGQSFIEESLGKIAEARDIIDTVVAGTDREIRIEVDGGVKIDNIARIREAGADTFVAGSAIFGQPDYAQVIDEMKQQITVG
ncbi:ribulose-phosphate 3-epimerase [Salinisphaera sp. SPP-AMP-43]|uniref:ribulose-phosphate 3-epimerase n=1 Tax=Salinisphaera sp. SPP-AMP-43 TaxID=3121288 RepID=UPI003C6DF669